MEQCSQQQSIVERGKHARTEIMMTPSLSFLGSHRSRATENARTLLRFQ